MVQWVGVPEIAQTFVWKRIVFNSPESFNTFVLIWAVFCRWTSLRTHRDSSNGPVSCRTQAFPTHLCKVELLSQEKVHVAKQILTHTQNMILLVFGFWAEGALANICLKPRSASVSLAICSHKVWVYLERLRPAKLHMMHPNLSQWYANNIPTTSQ